MAILDQRSVKNRALLEKKKQGKLKQRVKFFHPLQYWETRIP